MVIGGIKKLYIDKVFLATPPVSPNSMLGTPTNLVALHLMMWINKWLNGFSLAVCQLLEKEHRVLAAPMTIWQILPPPPRHMGHLN